MYYFWDWTWFLLVPAIILGIYAQIRVSSTYSRYAQIPSSRGMTGAQGARMVLDSEGLMDVGIQVGGGRLSDHYDPRNRTLTLSPVILSQRIEFCNQIKPIFMVVFGTGQAKK